MSLENLLNSLPAPDLPLGSGRGKPWPLIDDHVCFPSDYRDFINQYGSGSIAGFMAIFSPFSANEYLNFFAQKKLISEDFAYLVVEDADYYRFALYPAVPGLMPVGITDNGDTLFWLVTDPADSDRWTTAIIACRSPEVEYFDLNLTDLLAGILSKKILSTSLPENFPPEPIKFDKIVSV